MDMNKSQLFSINTKIDNYTNRGTYQYQKQSVSSNQIGQICKVSDTKVLDAFLDFELSESSDEFQPVPVVELSQNNKLKKYFGYLNDDVTEQRRLFERWNAKIGQMEYLAEQYQKCMHKQALQVEKFKDLVK
ncbi:Hypothetical_protein [Hexamita inflata]|uniref:Hypothetical_protein n=1 Tax=Hexamita inflata TaxID=28002 RepID=A0AA86R1Z0_9EUKA|nr:Hypothetical protein HINF_LOCUS56450 [Hexamita inflata]